MPCIFCKIVAHEIPNHTVFENEQVLAFLDVFPLTKGHTVVIPKQHVARLEDMTSEAWGELQQGVLEAARRVNEAIHPDGFNIGINNGEAAGQAVPHMHWHIIPRWQADGGGSIHSILKKPATPIDVTSVAQLFLA